MEWEPNERDAWVSDAQRWIGQINGVLQCKVDLDEAGEIAGVHVVAGMERDPRHIVRDVESLLKARLDVDVYYKKIGVVQVVDNGVQEVAVQDVAGQAGEDPDTDDQAPAEAAATAGDPQSGGESVPGSAVTFHPPRTDHDEPPVPNLPDPPRNSPADPAGDQTGSGDLPPPIPAILVAEEIAARVVCGSVGVMASDTTLRAEVLLSVGDVEARGLREGPNHAASDILLVAQATVAAVSELIADPVLLHLREVQLQDVGGHGVVLTAIDLVEGRQSTTLFGTCSTSHNRLQAVVYAVLDALNRRLSLHALKTLTGTG